MDIEQLSVVDGVVTSASPHTMSQTHLTIGNTLSFNVRPIFLLSHRPGWSYDIHVERTYHRDKFCCGNGSYFCAFYHL